MRCFRFGAMVLLGCSLLISEQSVIAQTVQLPSFSRFTYSGSVLVPTGGSTSLGGVSRSATGRTSRRFGGRGFGGAVGHAGATAHVTIIDNDAIDRQIRGLPPKGSPSHRNSVRSTSAVTPPATSKSVRGKPLSTDPDAEGKALVRFARKQYLVGKRTSSFDAYQLAIETLSPKLSELAKVECYRLFPSQKRPAGQQPHRFASTPPIAPP